MEVEEFYADVWRVLGEISDEATHSAHGPWARHADAVDVDEDHHASAFSGTPADAFDVAFKVFKARLQRFRGDETVRAHLPDNEDVLLSVLAICLRQVLRAKSTHSKTLMETFATASRNRESLSTRFCSSHPLTSGSKVAEAVWDNGSAFIQRRSNDETGAAAGLYTACYA